MTTLIIDTNMLLHWAPVAQTDAELVAGWQPVNPERLMHPSGVAAQARIDIKLRDGTIFYNRPAYAWCWGEAFETTITHWRYAK